MMSVGVHACVCAYVYVRLFFFFFLMHLLKAGFGHDCLLMPGLTSLIGDQAHGKYLLD